MNAKQMRKRAAELDKAAEFLEAVGAAQNIQAAYKYRQQSRELREAADKLERQKERQEA